MEMHCLRGSDAYRGLEGGDCQFRIQASERSSDGNAQIMTVDAEHTHALDDNRRPADCKKK